MIAATFAQAWDLYRKHFRLIASAVLIVWLPLEFFSSYMDAFVFDPEETRKSLKLGQFLENFFGIIATAAVISIGYVSHLGEEPTLGSAMAAGFDAWWRMWWTRFLTMLFVVVGLIALVIPGVYLVVRLAFVEPIAVCERRSGLSAIRRSFEVTEGRFWQVSLVGLAGVLAILALAAVVLVPAFVIPALEHWVLSAVLSLILDVLAAFGTLYFLSAYMTFATARDETATPG